MWSILFANRHQPFDELIAELWAQGTQGVIEEEDGLRAFFEDDVEVGSVSSLAGPEATVSYRQEATQTIVCKNDDVDPIVVGKRFFILPAESAQTAAPEGRLTIRISSPIAFGTGRHETTQLCLQAIERVLRIGQSVIDIGCGSGILSIAAALLGAGSVWSCDIDGEAVAATQRELSTPVFLGSADAVEDKCADLVLANISARVLDRLAFDLQRIVKNDGLLMISGFLEANPPQLFAPLEILESNGWLCWICKPEGIRVNADDRRNCGLDHDAQWWM